MKELAFFLACASIFLTVYFHQSKTVKLEEEMRKIKLEMNHLKSTVHSSNKRSKKVSLKEADPFCHEKNSNYSDQMNGNLRFKALPDGAVTYNGKVRGVSLEGLVSQWGNEIVIKSDKIRLELVPGEGCKFLKGFVYLYDKNDHDFKMEEIDFIKL